MKKIVLIGVCFLFIACFSKKHIAQKQEAKVVEVSEQKDLFVNDSSESKVERIVITTTETEYFKPSKDVDKGSIKSIKQTIVENVVKKDAGKSIVIENTKSNDKSSTLEDNVIQREEPAQDPYRYRYIFYVILLVVFVFLYLKRTNVLSFFKDVLIRILKLFK